LYTAAQAARGADEYARACAHCHRSDLLGDERAEIPSLAEDDFFLRWEGRPLERLFAMISQDMPADQPGRLSRQAYADILAYILQVNRFAAGSRELAIDPAPLAGITIERP
jgi:cytochrome c